jgi:hypothetical protein
MRNNVILRCFCGGLRESVKGKKEKKVAQKRALLAPRFRSSHQPVIDIH